ncbi:MAG TPA: hypothetical protein VFY93_02810 [Planctomycetota bacterium]|nr:hypothetical protein [Planctomycetota bacterium]
MRNRAPLLALLLAFGCGKKEQPKTTDGGATTAEAKKPVEPAQPPAPPAPDPAEIKKKRDELKAKVAEIEKARKDLEARHAEEKKGLPDLSMLRRTYIQAIVDARTKENELQRMLERQEELKRFAESAVSDKLKGLRETRKEIVTRQEAIQDAWRKSVQDDQLGVVEESPVKKDLDTLRAVKGQWFAATPLARRGTAKDGEKKIINEGFRGWLGEVPDRKRVVGAVLGLPQAPKGKTPDSYDFTDLKFFLLLQLMEQQMEKQNVAVEKKELVENLKKLDAIQAELDAVDAKIHEQVVEGGDEFQEYEDILSRLPLVQESASYLSTRVAELRGTLKQIDELKERQSQEEDDLLRSLEQARKELAKLR